MTTARSQLISGPAGHLEALLQNPAAAPLRAAVVCHPHPLYGGMMHNRVVHRIARSLVADRTVVLRFNFRGVGLSQGSYDGGGGELGDVQAAVETLHDLHPGLPILVAGYSFGAWVGMRFGAADPRVCAVAGVGLATTLHDFAELRATAKPKLVVQGTLDRFGPRESVEAATRTFAPPTEVVWVEGADHFFADSHAERVGDAVARFAGALAGMRSAPPRSGR